MGLTYEPRKPDFSFSFTYTTSNLTNTVYNIDWFSYASSVWIQNLHEGNFLWQTLGEVYIKEFL